MNHSITFRKAAAEEADYLTALAVRSKAYWGYPAEFMQACTDELTVSSTNLQSSDIHIVVAVIENQIVGFYTLEGLSGVEIELGALFVDPGYIGTGVGRALLGRAKRNAVQLGAGKLCIQGDPNATGFYLAAGGVPVGSRESDSIPGRFLPLFQIQLTDATIE